ncbi:MAG TPA: hypothetical protein PK830_00675 [Candidatus Atribacteria bacterium]|mgnify:CR=1 FL=1|nr:hypothetical protein [Candidatus Atribacteria bacterium]HPT77612.1 hypothetical protein [Candidatus Atribacteria bacterium]
MDRQPNSELKKAMRPALRRITAKHMLKYGASGLALALGLATIAHAVSFFIPYEGAWAISIAAMPLVMVSLAAGWLTRPTMYDAARTVDRLGLQEKATTALELSGRDDAFAVIQRRDAIDSLKRLDPRKISIGIPKLLYYVIALLVLSIGVLNMVPNPMDTVIERRKQVQDQLEDELDKLVDAIEEKAGEDGLTGEQKQALLDEIRELSEKLKGIKDYKEALKEVSKTEEEVNSLLKDIAGEKLSELANELAGHDITKSLADALKSLDPGKIQEALDELKDVLADETEGETEGRTKGDEAAEDLRDALEKVAQNLPEGSIKEGLVNIVEGLESGESADKAVESLEDLLENRTGTKNTSGEVKYAMQKIRKKLSDEIGSGEQIAGRDQDPGRPGKEGGQSGGQKGNEGENEDNSGNNGGGNQSGENSQNGEGGNGNGSQSGENGQGGQNGNGDQPGQNGQGGQGGNSSQSGSNGQNGGGIGSGSTGIEHIYDPGRLGDGGDVSHVPGKNTGKGDNEQNEDSGLGSLDGYIPYKQVIGQYESEAINSVERRALPKSIEAIVREYFASLDD